MCIVGIDLSRGRPRKLEREDAEWADVVATMGCGDACPYIPGNRYVDWDLADPSGRPLEEVRAVRDDIAGRVASWPRSSTSSQTAPDCDGLARRDSHLVRVRMTFRGGCGSDAIVRKTAVMPRHSAAGAGWSPRRTER